MEIAKYKAHSKTAINTILQQQIIVQENWRKTILKKRITYVQKIGKLLLKNKVHLAQLATAEMGKPISQAILEVEKCAGICDYYATNIEFFLQPVRVQSEAKQSFVTYQPIGGVLAVMPWNFPYWQVFRSMIPIILSGNTYILKPAPNVVGCTMAIANIIQQAKLPTGVVEVVLAAIPDVPNIIAHKSIAAVTLTGSTQAGSAVASIAGKYIKKCVLELGGTDASVILDDADINHAIQQCVYSRFINNGQSCIAAKRFIVTQKNHNEFVIKLTKAIQAIIVGNPTDKQVQLGPLARIDLKNTLQQQVAKCKKLGATITEIAIEENSDCFFAPTIITNIKPTMPAYNEELFGPVFSVIKVANNKEAIAVANDTSYGLGAVIYTKNTALGTSIATTELQAGACFVNAFARSVKDMPFGGIKQSGYGRELGKYGVHEFMNIKSVYVGG